jgi:hypothetical protein
MTIFIFKISGLEIEISIEKCFGPLLKKSPPPPPKSLDHLRIIWRVAMKIKVLSRI